MVTDLVDLVATFVTTLQLANFRLCTLCKVTHQVDVSHLYCYAFVLLLNKINQKG